MLISHSYRSLRLGNPHSLRNSAQGSTKKDAAKAHVNLSNMLLLARLISAACVSAERRMNHAMYEIVSAMSTTAGQALGDAVRLVAAAPATA